MSNSLRDEIKDAIAAALTGGQTIPDSADYEMAAGIADAVFGVMDISEQLQDEEMEKLVIEANKKENSYALIRWSVEDVLTLRPKWTKDAAENALSDASRYIQDRSIETGWAVLEDCLGDEDGGEWKEDEEVAKMSEGIDESEGGENVPDGFKNCKVAGSYQEAIDWLKAGNELWYEILDDPGQHTCYEDATEFLENFPTEDEFKEDDRHYYMVKKEAP